MKKIVKCSDLGFDCEGVVKADSEEEALAQVAQHAREAHGIETVDEEMVAQVRRVMQTEEEHD